MDDDLIDMGLKILVITILLLILLCIVEPLYNVAAAQQTGNAFWQAAEQVQEELEKAYRRVALLSSGASC